MENKGWIISLNMVLVMIARAVRRELQKAANLIADEKKVNNLTFCNPNDDDDTEDDDDVLYYRRMQVRESILQLVLVNTENRLRRRTGSPLV